MRQARTYQQAQSDARRARFRTLAEQIGSLSPDERLAMAARMSTTLTIEGRSLSTHNACLVACQKPDATMLGGFQQWIKAGRAVRKGEHGLMVWAPTMRRTNGNIEDAETASDLANARTQRPGFIMVTMFDVSQTDPLT